MFLFGLEWGGTRTYAWSSATVIGLFCGSFGMLVIFIAWEHRRGKTAMIPLHMLRDRIVWSCCAFIFFFFGALMIMSYYLAIWFQAVKGYTPTMSGVYVLPSILPQMVSAIISGIAGMSILKPNTLFTRCSRNIILVGKLGYYLPWAVFSGIVASIGAGLISSWTPETTTAKWVGYQVILGLGRGAGFQMVRTI